MAAHLRVVGDGAASFDPVAFAFLGEKTAPKTRTAYEADLRHFARHLTDGYSSEWTNGLSSRLYDASTAELAQMLSAYKTALLGGDASPATINRRLACVRSLLTFAHRLGKAEHDGRGLVDGIAAQTLRDTRGVSLSVLRKLIQLPDRLPTGPDGKPTVKALRDAALLRLFAENGLRRGEIAALRVSDFEPAAKRLLIQGKGKAGQKQPVTLSPKSVAALRAYLKAAGHKSGPLLRNVSHAGYCAGNGLTDSGIYRIVQAYGAQLDITLAPHKLRHSAITAVLHEVKGDVRKAQEFSRHKDVRTLFVYDDRRRDNQGKITRTLSRKL